MFGNILIATALSFAVGIGAVNTPEQNYNNDNINNVVFDDEDYQITLSVDELNNYTWENLYSTIVIIYNSENTFYFNYLDTQYSVIYDDDSGSISFFNSEDFTYSINMNVEYQFTIYTFSDGLQTTFNAVAEVSSPNTSLYDDIKSAIELDIQANTTQASMGSTIIDAIKSGLGLIGDLASQFLLGFSTLFWANNALTPFGTFALVMLGVAITMAVVSLVLRIIRGNTGA